ncbi:MAG: DUF1338 domain-containing protein [Rhodospirillaceae bacterium]|nr:DUF1338 domain-containing protein [Rhodospirillaceae bacterium]
MASSLDALLNKIVGADRAAMLHAVMIVHPALKVPDEHVSRAVLAQALNMALFSDLIARVPFAEAYVQDCLRTQRKVFHDHGALRTVAMSGMGALPPGEEAILRVIRPLGYVLGDVYPLEKLKMTGRSYKHADLPEDIAQFFISEFHPELFSPAFQDAVRRVTAPSRDPLTAKAKEILARLSCEGHLSFADASAVLPVLLACFACQHEPAHLGDYEMLLESSAEMAWISTEGNTFNHATDRVENVEAVAQEQKSLGRPMKDAVEISASGRVRQTAFRAAMVQRAFRAANSVIIMREVPGSFYEFITRQSMTDTATGQKKLDLAFDSSNAQGIFKMTSVV